MFWVQAVDHFSSRDGVEKRVYFLGYLMRVRGTIEPYALWRMILNHMIGQQCRMGLIRLAPN